MPVTLFWFRRDLRIEDNSALYHTLKSGNPVQPIFIFDTTILEKLSNKSDARVSFIHQSILKLQEKVREFGTTLDVRIGKPMDIWQNLVDEYDVKLVYANRDYEPYARERDKAVYEFLAEKGIEFKAKKDHVIFEKNEVLKDNGTPYLVFTPYSKKWKSILNDFYLKPYPSEQLTNWSQQSIKEIPTLEQIGFKPTNLTFPTESLDKNIVKTYNETRDTPSINGTTKMGLHLRFGTKSIRKLASNARKMNETYLNELIWRDFYSCILWHYPKVVGNNFNSKYDGIIWRNNEEEFAKWCDGKTGYPIVDAGMRELNATGYMHNRVRMIVASFLSKHLLIDWQWGESYFAEKLLDFELASNNGGWQWAAGTGVDAAPYFRVFNPELQTKKFDPQLKYVKKWVPEFGTSKYPSPIVDHKFARERALATYKEGFN